MWAGPLLRSFLRYYWTVFWRGIRDTRALIGWRRESLIFLITYAIGFLLFVRSSGFQRALDALLDDYYLVFVPFGIGAMILFIWNLVMAPVRLAKEQDRKIGALGTANEELRKRVSPPRRFQLLRRLHQQGTEMRQRVLQDHNDAHHIEWWESFNKWRYEVTSGVHAVSPSAAVRLERSTGTPLTSPVTYGGKVVSEKQWDTLRYLDLWLDQLQRTIDELERQQ